jgi:hypothetical protein
MWKSGLLLPELAGTTMLRQMYTCTKFRVRKSAAPRVALLLFLLGIFVDITVVVADPADATINATARKNVLLIMADDFNHWLKGVGYLPSEDPQSQCSGSKGSFVRQYLGRISHLPPLATSHVVRAQRCSHAD